MSRHARAAAVACLAALFALSIASMALASLRDEPVRIRLLGEPRAAAVGVPFEGTLRIEAYRDASLSSFTLAGPGWTVEALEAPVATLLRRGESLDVRFRAQPVFPDAALRFSYLADGVPGFIPVHLSPALLEPGRGTSPDWGVTAPAPTTGRPSLRIDRAGVRLAGRPGAGPSPGIVARTIRVHGKVAYFRIDGPQIGAYEAHVLIYHDVEGSVDDQLLDEVHTYSTGVFDRNVIWNGAGNPNLVVVFEPANDHVTVEPQSAAGWFYYRWGTGVWRNFAGGDLNVGTLFPPEDQMPALHILTTMTREYFWLKNLSPSWDTPHVAARWPDSSATNNSHYSRNDVAVYIADEQEWSESVECHEYGHHFLYSFGDPASSGYDNGICDPPEGPRHCDWCQETGEDAWNEGFSDWLAFVVPNSFLADYLVAARSIRYAENLEPCIEELGPNTGNACPCDPLRTEGFLTAFLNDLEDDTPGEDDPLAQGSWKDKVDGRPDDIVAVAAASWGGRSGPRTVQDFLDAWWAAFPGASIREDIWETGKNCGFELDATAPGNVIGLSSPSHTPGAGVSRDNTITFTWSRASDDASGNYLYSISTTHAPSQPDAFADISYVTSYTTPVLAAGTWYFNIRAIDRSGKVSATYVSLGPFTVDSYQPINLTYYLRPGWADVLVPRDANDATISVVDAPTTLPGNSASTYWNLSGRNTGEDPTGIGIDIHFLVDGRFRQTYTWGGSINSFATFYALNRGPLNISSGRHTVEGVLDAGEDVLETDPAGETDNLWAHQWIWTPYALTAGTAVTRAYPPDREGGWDAIVDGSTKWFNCDGLRLTTSGYWNAVWAYGTNLDDDYDCRLHTASTGAASGFAANLGWSSRAAGCLDAVLVNRNLTGNGSWDVGVLNYASFDPFVNASYKAKHVISSSFSFGDSVDLVMPASEMMLLEEFSVPIVNRGLVTITVRIDPANGPVYVAWFDHNFSTGALTSESALAVSDADGLARLDITINEAGWNCFAIYRDPKDGTGAIPMVVELENTPPDCTPRIAAGWWAPLVPRAAADGTATLVPAPVTLDGNAASTYFNFSWRNDSPAAAPAMTSHTWLDGVSTWAVSWAATAGNTDRTFNSGTARTVRGGRHVVAMALDDPDAFEELDENNNLYGEQWIWSPRNLTPGTPLTRAAPPDRIGGWDQITSGESHWFNCDGLRTPFFLPAGQDGYWAAVAVMPGDTSDADVRFHENSGGAKSGFASNLKLSAWGIGQSDFVLADFRRTPFRSFDAGVLHGTGAQNYTVETVSSLYRANAPSGTFGPFVLGANHIVDLHEFTLQAGNYDIEVENVAGTVDWGLSVHGAAASYYSKSEVVEGGAGWLAAAGANERILAEIPAAGEYCVAVWKAGRADLAGAGTYTLHVGPQVVGVPSALEAAIATRLEPAQPNPFARAAAIHFSLAGEGDVKVGVYDLAGARVRALAAGRMPPGRYQLSWDGCDETGRQVGPGIYLVRLEAGSYRESRKLIRLR